MAYCGPTRGTCGKQADCADTHCPGRNEALFNTSLHRVTAPDDRITSPESMGRAYAWLAVILVSLGCFLLYALIVYLASKGAAS